MTTPLINAPLSDYSIKLLSTYLDFPKDQPITAIDYRARDGNMLEKLFKKHEGVKHFYAVTDMHYEARYMREREEYERVCVANYKDESRIATNAFSLAILDHKVSSLMMSELFDSIDPFVEPDFEKEERKRLSVLDGTSDQLDLTQEEMTDEEKKVAEASFNEKLKESIKNRRTAYRRALRAQEKRLSNNRDDGFLLASAAQRLKAGGVLVMITPKEMIDQSVTLRLHNQFEDIQVLRLEDDEYEEKRKCIIIAKKRRQAVAQRSEGVLLAETKLTPYKKIDELEPQAKPFFKLPIASPDDVGFFRVGKMTADEVLSLSKRSNVLQTYQDTFSQALSTEKPVAPTPLHKGHIMLLLTSGFLNGYIGEGPNQHLVKGSARKLIRSRSETDDDGVTTIKEREFYDITVKYLNSNGDFKKIM